MDIPNPVVKQMFLAKLNRSHNKDKIHKSGNGTKGRSESREGRDGGTEGQGESHHDAKRICMKLSKNSLNGKTGTKNWSLWE